MEEKSFKPFISADRVLPELTPVSIGLGIILGIIFGAANAYLGLRIGLTISASIPAAVPVAKLGAWGFGSKELPAPQATLMKLVVEGN